jgi:hypothetical protein
MSLHLFSTNVACGVRTLALRALSSESDWCRFWGKVVRGGVRTFQWCAHEVFLEFLHRRCEENNGKRGNSGVLVHRGDARDLLDDCSEQEKYIGILGELLCGVNEHVGYRRGYVVLTNEKFGYKRKQGIFAGRDKVGREIVIGGLVIESNESVSG